MKAWIKYFLLAHTLCLALGCIAACDVVEEADGQSSDAETTVDATEPATTAPETDSEATTTESEAGEVTTEPVTESTSTEPETEPGDSTEPDSTEPETEPRPVPEMNISMSDLSDIMQPLMWKNNGTVKSETVMFLDKSAPYNAKTLMYDPVEILSVTSYNETVTYTEGVDYELRDGKLVILEGSSIPCIGLDTYHNGDGMIQKDGHSLFWGEGSTMTAWQVCVNYTTADTWTGYEQKSYTDIYANFLCKLERGEDVTIFFYGDSITYGANASYYVGGGTGQYPYPILFTNALADLYGYTVNYVRTVSNPVLPAESYVAGDRGTITYVNTAVGGWTSQAGLDKVNTHVKPYLNNFGCDLFVYAFGMNDGGASNNAMTAKNAQTMFDQYIIPFYPDAAFMMVTTMVPHPGSTWDGSQKNQATYFDRVASSYAKEGVDVAVANMTKVTQSLYERKDFEDSTGNNINHPNDFLGRIYAQTLLQTLIGYENMGD